VGLGWASILLQFRSEKGENNPFSQGGKGRRLRLHGRNISLNKKKKEKERGT